MKILKRSLQTNQGFTLLELLVVIAIIAILIALGTVSYSTAQKKSRDAKRRSDVKEIQNALETYNSINGNYPAEADISTEMDTTEYFSSGARPTDPKSGADYTYTYDSSNYLYCLCGQLELTGTGNADTAGSGGACSYTAGDYFCASSLQ